MGFASRSIVTLPRQQTPPDAAPRVVLLHRIAASVDGSATDSGVLRHAAAIASAFAVPLTILRVLETGPHEVPPDPVAWEVRRREVKTDLDRLASAAARRIEGEVAAELLQGRAAEQISQWAATHEADLMVLARAGEHGGGHWRLSSTARKLVDGTSVSLLLTPANTVQTNDLPKYRRILVPLDGSPRGESALPIALHLATTHRAEVLLVHVVPAVELTEVGPLTREDVELKQQVAQRNERVARTYLEGIRSRASVPGPAIRIVLLRGGDVRRRLVELISQEGVDLGVLSAHGQSGASETPYGSVASHLLTHSNIPLLLRRERPSQIARVMAPEASRRTPSRLDDHDAV